MALLKPLDLMTRYGISRNTLDNWIKHPAMRFPKPLALRLDGRATRVWRPHDLNLWDAWRAENFPDKPSKPKRPAVKRNKVMRADLIHADEICTRLDITGRTFNRWLNQPERKIPEPFVGLVWKRDEMEAWMMSRHAVRHAGLAHA